MEQITPIVNHTHPVYLFLREFSLQDSRSSSKCPVLLKVPLHATTWLSSNRYCCSFMLFTQPA
ncbi:hypothetical protein BZL31_24020 [Escherichia coli]|nr:hypothetical protein BZL31_24020 [Escherichia coli]OUK76637.1 hypothetical protein BZL68_28085 [Escherichia coli]OUK84033.1 hypothetical protein BZL69_30735 [Escherichia coli]OUK89738.1 hypothetical protein BZL70_24540 [Escherichia coli]